MRAAAAVVCAAAVQGHFTIQVPYNWQDPAGAIGMSLLNGRGQQCTAGCTGKHAPGEMEAAQGCSCEWYTNWTFIDKGAATIADDSPLRTWGLAPFPRPECGSKVTLQCPIPLGSSERHPWRAPGLAPIFSPCGHDGGNPQGCPAGASALGGVCADGGYGHGPDARSLPGNAKPYEWGRAGGTAEVAWAIQANHGGGYSVRVCPKPKDRADLTEECFQQHVLRFHGDTHGVQWGPDASTRRSIPAMSVETGTVPAGSQWRRNPIPACSGYTGGAPGGQAPGTTGVCVKKQFDPPLPGLYGFGQGGVNQQQFNFSIVDTVEIPADLPAGDYVLSVRWDCEQTPQIWNSCADIRIAAGSGPAPPAPAPAATYACVNNECVPNPSGVAKATCTAVCHK